MARFGANGFTSFSVPLVFEGRYFILEPGDLPRVSVVREYQGVYAFEVMRNEPVDNPVTEVTKTAAGTIIVSDRRSGKFLYRVHPQYETSVVFGVMDGSEVPVVIRGRKMQVGGISIEKAVLGDRMAGVLVRSDGSVRIGTPIPPAVLHWLRS